MSDTFHGSQICRKMSGFPGRLVISWSSHPGISQLSGFEMTISAAEIHQKDTVIHLYKKDAPWDWNICLHENHRISPNVGKYTSSIDGVG